MERLSEAFRSFLPGPDSKPEPYWAIVGVNAHGEATGDLWGAQPRTVTLFDSAELGAAALKLAGSPSPEPQMRTVRWEVRGLSRAALQWLQNEPALRPLRGVEVSAARIVTEPLR
jgi:hypothetical protein